MKRNTFFARFLVTNAFTDNEGEGFVVEQYFTTRELYVIEPLEVEPLMPIGRRLATRICNSDKYIAETSNGVLFQSDDSNESNWGAGYLTVGFDVIEDGTHFPTLDNLRVAFITRGGTGVNSIISPPRYAVAAFAIGTIKDQGSINTNAMSFDNTVWIMGTDQRIGNTLRPALIRSSKFDLSTVFVHPSYLPTKGRLMEDYQFVGVYQEPDPSGETDDCCTSQNHSNAINAAAILVASNNATTPALIKKIEDAVGNNFDLPSTLSALQSMRQLGTLSNMTGKVLDNLVRNDIDTDFNIKNGKEAE